jgi:hypothetical protein
MPLPVAQPANGDMGIGGGFEAQAAFHFLVNVCENVSVSSLSLSVPVYVKVTVLPLTE